MNRNNMKRNKISIESKHSITLSLRLVFLVLALNNLIMSGHAFQASSAFTTGIRHQCFVPHPSPSIIRSVSSQYHKTRNNLNMHLGHSHSHHEHEHHHHHHGDDSSGTSSIISKMKTTCTNKRILSRLAFATLVSFLTPLLIRRTSKVALFAGSSTALFLLDQIQSKVTGVIRRTKNLCHKMSLSNSSSSTTATVDRRSADQVTYLGILVNLLLSIGKAIVGVKCHSAALVADAGHSFSDLFSDFITLGAVRIGRLPADEDHPYGHGKFEAIGSLFLSLTLLATGLSVGLVSYRRLVDMCSASLTSAASSVHRTSIPTFPALIMAGLSVLSKEWLYKITRRVGERIRSPVIIANAWHHRSDAYSSVLALVSVGLAMAFPSLLFMDAAAGLLVAGMIAQAGFEIGMESVGQLTDTNDRELVQRIETLIQREEIEGTGDVLEVKQVRARQVGSATMVDVKVITRGGVDLTSSELQTIEDRIRWKIVEESSSITQMEGEDHHHHGSGGMDMDVEVCARPSFKNKQKDNERISISNNTESVEQETTSILLNHPRVKSVGDVSVRYHDDSTIDVGVHIQLSSTTTSLNEAILLTQELRTALEKKTNVREAKIYLDLHHQEIPSPTSTSTSTSIILPSEAETRAIMQSFEEAIATRRNNAMASSLPWLFDTTGDVTSTDNVIKTIEIAMQNTNMTNSLPYLE